MNIFFRRGLAALALLVTAGYDRLEAVPVFESASPGPTGAGAGGISVNSQQYLGARFTLLGATDVTYVGGLFGSSEPDTKVFAALLGLAGPTALPSGLPFSGPDVLASAMFTVNPLLNDVYVPLAITLPPGTYGLVFGQGMFGADEPLQRSASLSAENLLVPGNNSFFRWSSFSNEWQPAALMAFPPDPSRGVRFFVGTGEVPGASVPDHGPAQGAVFAVFVLCGLAAHRLSSRSSRQ